VRGEEMNKKIIIPAILIVALVAGVGITKNIKNASTVEAEPNTSIAVKTENVKVGSIVDEVYTIGEVTPEKVFQVNPMVTGKVSEVYVEVGDRVKKDQILYKMDMSEFNIETSSQIEQVKNNLAIVKDQFDLAKKSFEDTSKLYESKAVAEYAYDQAKLQYESAEKNYENVLNSYDTAIASIGEKNDYYVIKSPIDGLVTGKTVEVGMTGSPQSGVTVIVTDPLIVKGTITSKHINKVEVGQPVRVQIATTESELEGKISAVSYSAKNGSYPIEVNIELEDELVKPGMYAELFINVNTEDEATLISEKALIVDGNAKYVYKVVEDKAVKVEVEKVLEEKEIIQVTGDLKAGDKIVTIGKENIVDGTKLTIVE